MMNKFRLAAAVAAMMLATGAARAAGTTGAAVTADGENSGRTEQTYSEKSGRAWKGKWISKQECRSGSNVWLAFRKGFEVASVPQSVPTRIAADTKYWLWINDSLVVFEGGLKRGPAPGDSYYDEIDIAPYLRPGHNCVAALVWHFGLNGFSHADSGTAGFLFDAQAPGLEILSDKTWQASVFHAYGTAGAPEPNYRLPESNLRFDARKDFKKSWRDEKQWLGRSMELPVTVGEPPFGKLVERPIPMWKDYGMKEYESVTRSGDTLVCALPYNAQVTPYLKVKAPAGRTVQMLTDHYRVGRDKTLSLRAEYVTKDGVQEYESLGWLNGDKMFYIVPSDVEVLDVKYRETGYFTEFSGSFECDDPFLNEYWRKAVRTLYVCMRDTYMDCPDRERAQWWGDEVNELGMAFYALSPSSWKLAVKGIHELMNWQRANGVISAPMPAMNYSSELPSQMLASVGWYGLRTQYFYSADSSFVPAVYDRMKRYLHEVWKLDQDGIPVYRTGDWDWPDSGSPVDKYALMPCLYQLALKGELDFARMLGKTEDAEMIESTMDRLKESYNRIYWTGNGYRHPSYEGPTDDRAQAMAILSGIASQDKYPALVEILKTTDLASTYMEKYMVEALFVAGESNAAIERMKRNMARVMDDRSSTLYEHWDWTNSSNHAWSGANIILLGQKVCGIAPTAPGFRTFAVRPQMGPLKSASASIETLYGKISVSLSRKSSRSATASLTVTVPEGTSATVTAADGNDTVLSPGTHNLKIRLGQ
jgi:alpha-L-rhamnosidase